MAPLDWAESRKEEKVRRAGERVGRGAEHLAAGLGDELRRVALELLAEHVVGGEEIPFVAARLDHGAAGRLGEHVGIVGPVDGDGRALRAGQVARGSAVVDVGLVLFLADIVDRERDRGGRHVEDHVHPVAVEPLLGDAGAHVRLVLVVGAQHLDGEVRLELGDGLLHGGDRVHAANVAIGAGHVVQHAEPDGLALRAGATCRGEGGAKGGAAAEHGAAIDRVGQRGLLLHQLFTRLQPPLSSGRNAWSAGVLATGL